MFQRFFLDAGEIARRNQLSQQKEVSLDSILVKLTNSYALTRQEDLREFSFLKAGKHAKNVKQICTADPYGESMGAYNSIEAGISTKIQQKYCDFIGFHA